MERSAAQLQANRPAIRRLHRRSALALRPPCVLPQPVAVALTEVIAPLSQQIVRDAGMFELLAAEMRIAELEAALAEANAAAVSDPLTGALNRRGFDAACVREFARARRNGSSLAVAHLDLDDFKRINDSQGHAGGDRALVHLVNVLQRLMRPSDVLCRFGGEEFVLLLPDTVLADAIAALGRYLREFAASPINGCALSFSAGIVVARDDESPAAAIARADAATFVAKRAGKNRVIAG